MMFRQRDYGRGVVNDTRHFYFVCEAILSILYSLSNLHLADLLRAFDSWKAINKIKKSFHCCTLTSLSPLYGVG